MILKNVFFVGFIISIFWYIIWQIGYIDLPTMADFERKTYLLMANLKFLTVLAFYIAWRVTPGSKPQ